MEFKKEYYKNAKSIKLVSRIFNWTFIVCGVYAGILTAMSVVAFLFSIITLTGVLPLLFGGVLCHAGYIALALYGNYNKQVHLTIAAPVLVGVAILIFSGTNEDGSGGFLYLYDCILAPIAFVCAGLTVYAIKKYLWLEQQEGFPHFNHLLAGEEEKSRESRFIDKYADYAKELKVSETNEMNEIRTAGTIENHVQQKNDFMNDVSISDTVGDMVKTNNETKNDFMDGV